MVACGSDQKNGLTSMFHRFLFQQYSFRVTNKKTREISKSDKKALNVLFTVCCAIVNSSRWILPQAISASVSYI